MKKTTNYITKLINIVSKNVNVSINEVMEQTGLSQQICVGCIKGLSLRGIEYKNKTFSVTKLFVLIDLVKSVMASNVKDVLVVVNDACSRIGIDKMTKTEFDSFVKKYV